MENMNMSVFKTSIFINGVIHLISLYIWLCILMRSEVISGAH